jgi:hypothetical protein
VSDAIKLVMLGLRQPFVIMAVVVKYVGGMMGGAMYIIGS